MNRLRILREQNNLLQSDIAKLINITPQAVGLYENEKRDIPTNILVQLADYFNVSTDYILGITSYKKPKEELEKALYELNLTEYEFDNLIETFNEKKEIEISVQYLKNLPDISKKRENEIIGTILKYVCDYIPNFSNTMTEEQEEKLNKTIETNLLKAKSVVDSLDKSKIINNYNDKDEQEFKSKYAKEIDGLTDEEIKLALQFYKEMKNKVKGDN